MVALVCEWEGDWDRELQELLGGIFGPVDQVIGIIGKWG